MRAPGSPTSRPASTRTAPRSRTSRGRPPSRSRPTVLRRPHVYRDDPVRTGHRHPQRGGGRRREPDHGCVRSRSASIRVDPRGHRRSPERAGLPRRRCRAGFVLVSPRSHRPDRRRSPRTAARRRCGSTAHSTRGSPPVRSSCSSTDGRSRTSRRSGRTGRSSPSRDPRDLPERRHRRGHGDRRSRHQAGGLHDPCPAPHGTQLAALAAARPRHPGVGDRRQVRSRPRQRRWIAQHVQVAPAPSQRTVSAAASPVPARPSASGWFRDLEPGTIHISTEEDL